MLWPLWGCQGESQCGGSWVSGSCNLKSERLKYRLVRGRPAFKMRFPKRVLFLRIGVLLVLVAGFSAGAAPESRIVAIGDVHGDYADFSTILQQVGLTDAQHHWTGGTTTFVQTGDVPDRGPQSRQAFDLLRQLEVEAGKQGGKVIPLLGNHEVMDMVGDVRYVTPEDFKNFADDNSEKRREAEWEDYKKFLTYHRGHQHSLFGDDPASQEKWMAAHPPGFFEERDAMGPKGDYGRWLRSHDAVTQVGEILFMHGGLDPSMHFKNIQELNQDIRKQLALYDSLWESLSKQHIIWRYMTFGEALKQIQEEYMEMRTRGVPDQMAMDEMSRMNNMTSGMLFAPTSPLWYRGYALEPEEKLQRPFDAMMKRLKAQYLVAAHTVSQKHDITPHLDHHVFLIDTGMLTSYFGGRASALIIEGGTFKAVYLGGESQVLLPPLAPAGGAKAQP
jgi:calcineurin-like phosphoesterase family protein